GDARARAHALHPPIEEDRLAAILELRHDRDGASLPGLAQLTGLVGHELERLVPRHRLQRVAVTPLSAGETVGVIDLLQRRLAAHAERALIDRMVGIPLELHDAAVAVAREHAAAGWALTAHGREIRRDAGNDLLVRHDERQDPLGRLLAAARGSDGARRRDDLEEVASFHLNGAPARLESWVRVIGTRGCARRKWRAMSTRGCARRKWRAKYAGLRPQNAASDGQARRHSSETNDTCAGGALSGFSTNDPVSMVARDAVERGMSPARRVLPSVALDAPAHGEWRRRRAQAHQVQEVVAELLTGTRRPHRRHGLHRAMTRLAAEPGTDVRLVRKVRELRQLVDAHPRHRLALTRVLGELLDLGLVGRRDLVTAHAARDGGQARVLRAARVSVTVLAVDLVLLDVRTVREVDRLRGRRGDGGLTTPRRYSQEDQNGEERGSERSNTRPRTHRQSNSLRAFERSVCNVSPASNRSQR